MTTRRGFLASLAAAVAGARALLAGTPSDTPFGVVHGDGSGFARRPAEGDTYRMWATGGTYVPETHLMFDGVEYRVTAYSAASGTVTYERIAERGV